MPVKNEWSLDGGMITFGAPVGQPTRHLDPVCGMEVPASAGQVATFAGEQYRFCSPSCRGKFLEDPERYAVAAAEPGKKEESR